MIVFSPGYSPPLLTATVEIFRFGVPLDFWGVPRSRYFGIRRRCRLPFFFFHFALFCFGAAASDWLFFRFCGVNGLSFFLVVGGGGGGG